MDATEAPQTPHSAPAPEVGAATSPGTRDVLRSTGILDLPDDVLVEGVLKAAMTDPSAFKKVVLVCRSWAASAPGRVSHVVIRPHAQIPGDLLAEEMARLSRVVSLRLHEESVRGRLPTTHTRREGGGEAHWTANLETLVVDDVELVPADVSLAFPKLTRLSLNFDEGKQGELPKWVENQFPPGLEHLRLCCFESSPSVVQPISEYRGFPITLVSLHLESRGKRFTYRLGDLTGLTSLTIDGSDVTSLPESIGNLRQLRNLNIHESTDLISLPGSISNLVSLSSLRLSEILFERLISVPTSTSLYVFSSTPGRDWRALPGILRDAATSRRSISILIAWTVSRIWEVSGASGICCWRFQS